MVRQVVGQVARPIVGKIVGKIAGQVASEVAGEVVDVRSRWTSARDLIVSDVTIRMPDGSSVVATQLGGTVDGIGMIASHDPPVLHTGQSVRAILRAASAPGAASSAAPSYQLMRATALADESRNLMGAEPPTFARYGVNRTKQSGVPIFWPTGCIHLAFHAVGTTHLPDDEEFDVLEQSLREWEDETSVCAGLSFSSTLINSTTGGRDYVNTVLWREDRWCRPPTSPLEPELCHEPEAIAVTQVYFVDNPLNPLDGQIVEADIEFNGVNFALAKDGQSLGTAERVMDMQSAATHELGHLLGLAHNCWFDPLEQPTDHQGNLVPACVDVVAGTEQAEATMFFTQQENEVKKATLESSDVLGGCATLGGRQCERVVHGASCAVALDSGGASNWPGLLVLLAVFAVFAVSVRNSLRLGEPT